MGEGGDRSASELGTNDLLLAILTLLVDGRERLAADRNDQVKTEVLLANSGLSYTTIARLLGKKPDAVRMMIARARGSQGKASRKANVGAAESSVVEGGPNA